MKKPRLDPTERKWRKRARAMLNARVRDGRIQRPSTCQRCHQPAKVNGHHTNYDREYDVLWLCRRCHDEVEIGELVWTQRRDTQFLTQMYPGHPWVVVAKTNGINNDRGET